MEHYHNSVQGICIIKYIDLPPEIIHKIRYFCNFSADLSGYTRRDLLRYITTDHVTLKYFMNTMHRSQIIRRLYSDRIHVKPRKKKFNRFEEICKLNLSSIEFIHRNIWFKIQNDDCYIISTKPREQNIKLKYKIQDRFKCIYIFGYFGSKVHKFSNKISLPFLRYNNNNVYMFEIQFNVWDYLFIVLHNNSKSILYKHFFETMTESQKKLYFEYLQEFNITTEKSLSKKFFKDCHNSFLEYVNLKTLF